MWNIDNRWFDVAVLGDERHHLVVAVDRGQVIGLVSGVHYVHPDKPSEMWINEVGVAASHQGQGVYHSAMRLYASTGGQQAPHDQVMFTFFLDQRPLS